jgi:hypothetical protein
VTGTNEEVPTSLLANQGEAPVSSRTRSTGPPEAISIKSINDNPHYGLSSHQFGKNFVYHFFSILVMKYCIKTHDLLRYRSEEVGMLMIFKAHDLLRYRSEEVGMWMIFKAHDLLRYRSEEVGMWMIFKTHDLLRYRSEEVGMLMIFKTHDLLRYRSEEVGMWMIFKTHDLLRYRSEEVGMWMMSKAHDLLRYRSEEVGMWMLVVVVNGVNHCNKSTPPPYFFYPRPILMKFLPIFNFLLQVNPLTIQVSHKAAGGRLT